MDTDVITSRENPFAKQCRALAQDPTAYRKVGLVWLEGDHLCRALIARGQQPRTVVVAASHQDGVEQWGVSPSVRRVVVADRLMAWISGLESPPHAACLHALPDHQEVAADVRPGVATVVLDRLQDPGNVGSILRSAAAFGFHQIVALKGTAALWSQKVLRAGMGAHFGLHLVEGATPDALGALAIPVLATSSHHGAWLHEARLPWPAAWVMGHEGQGVSPPLMAMATHHVRIAQPGGEESLNVAAAAAICLHASAAASERARL